MLIQYHGLCYTNFETLAGIKYTPMGTSSVIDPTTHHIMNGWSITDLHLAPAGIKYTPMGTSSVIDLMTSHYE